MSQYSLITLLGLKVFADSVDFCFLRFLAGSQDTPKTVVTYCAVGMRASIMARRLAAELDKPYNQYMKSNIDVYNLEGAIFKWANEMRGLEDLLGRSTKLAHPFDKFLWCHLMDVRVRGYGENSRG